MHDAINTPVPRPASKWRPDAYKAATPALQAIIAAVQATRRQVAAAHKRIEPLSGAAAKAGMEALPTQAELDAAMDAVPVPPVLRVPHRGDHLATVVMVYSDGREERTELAPDGCFMLDSEERIDSYHANDPAAHAEALAALKAYREARGKAAGVVHKQRREASAEYLAADAAVRAAYEGVLTPAIERHEAALKALWSYEPQDSMDRFAHVLALLEEDSRAKITRSGQIKDAEIVFEGSEGDALASLMLAALEAAAQEFPTIVGPDTLNAYYDRHKAAFGEGADSTARALVHEYEAHGGVIQYFESPEGCGVAIQEIRGRSQRANEVRQCLAFPGLQDALVRALKSLGRVQRFGDHGDAVATAAEATDFAETAAMEFEPLTPEKAAAPSAKRWAEYSARALFSLRLAEKILVLPKDQLIAEIERWGGEDGKPLCAIAAEQLTDTAEFFEACNTNVTSARARLFVAMANYAADADGAVDEDVIASAPDYARTPEAYAHA